MIFDKLRRRQDSTAQALADLTAMIEAMRAADQEPHRSPAVLDALDARIYQLELTLEKRLAEADAIAIAAESRFAASRASEERVRARLAKQAADDGYGELDEEEVSDEQLQLLQEQSEPNGRLVPGDESALDAAVLKANFGI